MMGRQGFPCLWIFTVVCRSDLSWDENRMSNIPGVVHYDSSGTLISRFDDYIRAFPEFCESFAFLLRKIVVDSGWLRGHNVIFDSVDKSVKG